MSMRLLLNYTKGWVLVVRRADPVIKRLELSLPPPQPLHLLGRAEGLEIEFNHQWPMILSNMLMKETTMKTHKDSSKSFQ